MYEYQSEEDVNFEEEFMRLFNQPIPKANHDRQIVIDNTLVLSVQAW